MSEEIDRVHKARFASALERHGKAVVDLAMSTERFRVAERAMAAAEKEQGAASDELFGAARNLAHATPTTEAA